MFNAYEMTYKLWLLICFMFDEKRLNKLIEDLMIFVHNTPHSTYQIQIKIILLKSYMSRLEQHTCQDKFAHKT